MSAIQVVEAHLPGYAMAIIPAGITLGLLICDTCGALVAQMRAEQHDAWHRSDGQRQGAVPQ